MVPTAQQRTGSTTTSNSNRPVIAFVGAGNMAEAIIGGLYASGHPASHLRYSEPVQERRRYMQQKYPEITATHDNNEAVRGAQVVILAVKPQVMRLVVQTLELPTTENVLVISIAAGIRTTDIARWFKDNNAAAAEIPVVRCMPNTPALIGEGAVGLYAVEAVSTEQRQLAETIMGSIAKKVCWVQQEKLMDTITALSGSGPAYYFLFMEAMQNAAVAAGLDPEDAKALTMQTCLGAARMALESEDDLATLRQKVTSPNGTTEAALKSMEAANIRQIIQDGVFAAEHRGQELAEELGKD